ncbi:MAG: Fe3+/spermidine/putrescine ABC transporter ATP-binding protein, partial [Nitrospiraceae bacterium]|nr:Fe3+/spermidine/putrescine ABC transporter ATP-binding protein [Nitrospiraceae bacterium]
RSGALLLDEPFSALDSGLRAEMGRLLLEIRREFGVPVVLVTHDIREARAVADKLIVYSGGMVVQTGSPREVMERPARDDIAELVGLL